MVLDGLYIPYPEWAPDLNTVLFCSIVVIAAGILMMPLFAVVASYIVFRKTMCRNSPDQWNGIQYEDLTPDQAEMYAVGEQWHQKYLDKARDVHIKNKGFNLYGEYYDFGSDSAVIILSGRSECHVYGYYFAIPYSEMGMNVLVIDPRAHGKSDGKYNTAGFEESGDTLAWSQYLHERCGVQSIIYHGICIGAAGAMYAITADNCPDYVKGMVAEGMYVNFSESMKNHLIERKKPVFMVNTMINFWIKSYTGHSMEFGPLDVIHKLKKPLLMIHSKEDLYSTPENAVKLYENCGAEDKRLVWYEHGAHSVLRITNPEVYDNAVKCFVNDVIY